MANCDWRPVWIDVRGIVCKSELAQHGKALRGKRFVELDHIHLPDIQAARRCHAALPGSPIMPVASPQARPRGLDIRKMDVVELNEAFASQGLACCASSDLQTMPRTSIQTGAPSQLAILSG